MRPAKGKRTGHPVWRVEPGSALRAAAGGCSCLLIARRDAGRGVPSVRPPETASIATALDVGDRYDRHSAKEEVVHCLPGPGGTYFDRDRSDAVQFCAPRHSDCPRRGTNRRRYLCRDNRAGRIFEAAMGAASVVSSPASGLFGPGAERDYFSCRQIEPLTHKDVISIRIGQHEAAAIIDAVAAPSGLVRFQADVGSSTPRPAFKGTNRL
jgi:hypothetical protein